MATHCTLRKEFHCKREGIIPILVVQVVVSVGLDELGVSDLIRPPCGWRKSEICP